MRITFIIALLAISMPAAVIAQQANPLDISPPISAYEYRLGISVKSHPRGVAVTRVPFGSPARRMSSASNANSTRALRVNDVITHVGAVAIQSQDEFRHQLDASDGNAQLRVINGRTRGVAVWDVRPYRVTVTVNRGPTSATPNTRPMLFAYLIADTNDPHIGNGIAQSRDRMKALLESRIHKRQLFLRIIEGDSCTASNIVRQLARTPSAPTDAIFVYYMGHGANDQRFASGDPSGGHYLDLPGRDLMRRTIWNYLNAAPAKLRIFMTDACNVPGSADPLKYRMEMRVRATAVEGPTGLEWLLLGHRGRLDISAASAGQYAWYEDAFGGYFSNQWMDVAKTASATEPDWESTIRQLRTQTDRFYQQQRATILEQSSDLPAAIRNQLTSQTKMTPVVFQKRLTRDAASPVDPQLRRIIEDQYITRVPVAP